MFFTLIVDVLTMTYFFWRHILYSTLTPLTSFHSRWRKPWWCWRMTPPWRQHPPPAPRETSQPGTSPSHISTSMMTMWRGRGFLCSVSMLSAMTGRQVRLSRPGLLSHVFLLHCTMFSSELSSLFVGYNFVFRVRIWSITCDIIVSSCSLKWLGKILM